MARKLPTTSVGDYKRADTPDGHRPLSEVLAEHDLFTSQREARRKLLQKIETLTSSRGRRAAAIGFVSNDAFAGSIDQQDIPAFGDILMSVGDVDTLNVIIDSPGGDGPTAEKLIELCRAYCRRLHVIVPNRAKSAATIIALGADEIVMGHCSELGPIDAQVPIIIGGLPRYVSAQSFIDAKESLQKEFAERLAKDAKADMRDLLQQLASMDVSFIDHCRKLMGFCHDVARKNLERHMFAEMSPESKRREAINRVIRELSQPDNFHVHARMVDGHTAKTKLKLNVSLLPKDSELWKTIWQYYIRADVCLSGRQGAPSVKVVESRNESLILAPTAVPAF